MGLLKPAYVGENGYRYYERSQALRLQQILVWRELGLRIDAIKAILDDPGFDLATALRDQQNRLAQEIARHSQIFGVITETLNSLSGDHTMTHEKFYAWTSEQKQAEYEHWLLEKYGETMKPQIETGRARFATLDEAGRSAIMTKLETVETDLVNAFKAEIPSDSMALDGVLKAHNDWVAFMWDRPCPPEAYQGLAKLYLNSPDFTARYESMAVGFCQFLHDAMMAASQRWMKV